MRHRIGVKVHVSKSHPTDLGGESQGGGEERERQAGIEREGSCGWTYAHHAVGFRSKKTKDDIQRLCRANANL